MEKRSVTTLKLCCSNESIHPNGGGVNEHGLTRKHIIEQCDESLKRLGLDYINLYQYHRPDPHVPLEETMMPWMT
jgi:aryl-alcohol dehydrogenase-like predicted oxidoreductase